MTECDFCHKKLQNDDILHHFDSGRTVMCDACAKNSNPDEYLRRDDVYDEMRKRWIKT